MVILIRNHYCFRCVNYIKYKLYDTINLIYYMLHIFSTHIFLIQNFFNIDINLDVYICFHVYVCKYIYVLIYTHTKIHTL